MFQLRTPDRLQCGHVRFPPFHQFRPSAVFAKWLKFRRLRAGTSIALPLDNDISPQARLAGSSDWHRDRCRRGGGGFAAGASDVVCRASSQQRSGGSGVAGKCEAHARPGTVDGRHPVAGSRGEFALRRPFDPVPAGNATRRVRAGRVRDARGEGIHGAQRLALRLAGGSHAGAGSPAREDPVEEESVGARFG